MRPLFCGNLDSDVRQSEIERLFRRYGRIQRVDMKSGFAFVYMEDERDADVAIRRLDRIEFGRKGRLLRVEWTRHERDTRRAIGGRSSANAKPSKTLFVINFDPIYTRTRDLERLFEVYGKIINIRIKRNFAFVEFESEDDACKALKATNMTKLVDRVITVEYAIGDDDDRRNGHNQDRRGHERRRSPGPYGRERASPDYGYRRERQSPDYGHANPKPQARGSPGYVKPEPRGSPGYVKPESRGYVKPEPRDYVKPEPRDYVKPEPRGSPGYARSRSRSRSPANGRYDSRSPPRRERSRS